MAPTDADELADDGDGHDDPRTHLTPAVLSPGDSDAPDVPDPDTIYPDRQGVPGDPDDEPPR